MGPMMKKSEFQSLCGGRLAAGTTPTCICLSTAGSCSLTAYGRGQYVADSELIGAKESNAIMVAGAKNCYYRHNAHWAGSAAA